MNELLYYTRPRTVNKAELNGIVHDFKKNVMNVKGTAQMLELIHNTKNHISKIDVDRSIKPVKIGIIGEIYTIIEPFTNLNVEERLGDLGVEVHRSMTVKDWARNTIILPITGRRGYKMEKKLSKKMFTFLSLYSFNIFIGDIKNKFDLTFLSIVLIQIAFVLLFISIISYVDGRNTVKLFIRYLLYGIYILTWIPITVQGILNKDNKEWCHTKHTRQISINEIEGMDGQSAA
jgi:hypothetical protein